ncbi:MAG: AsmA family protein [Pseudomonadota bacterium]
MKRFLAGALVLVAMLAALAVIAPMLISGESLKPRIETAATSALSRNVKVNGNISLAVFPSIALVANDVVVSNPAGFDAENFLELEQLRFSLALLPLLSRNISIKEFVLVEPLFNLESNQDGAVNWVFESGNTPETESADTANGVSIEELSLGDVRVARGQVHYVDAANETEIDVTSIDLKALVDSLDTPAEVNGDFVVSGEDATLQLVASSLRFLVDMSENATVKASAKIAGADLGIDGTASLTDGAAFNGSVSSIVPDLRSLLAIANVDMGETPGFETLSFEGDLSGDETGATFDFKKLAIDAITGEAKGNINWSGARPMFQAAMVLEQLDLRPYLPAESAPTEGFPAWSTDPIDMTALNLIDGEIAAQVGKILLNGLTVDAARMNATLQNGVLTADLPEMTLYNGAGSGRLVVNAARREPRLEGNFKLNNVSAGDFVLDLAKINRLLGVAELQFDFSATGTNQADMISTLRGKGRANIIDGAIKGVNFGKIIRSVAELRNGASAEQLTRAITTARGETEQTDFSSLAAQFAIDTGTSNFQTVTVTAPFLELTGAGLIDLPKQLIDLRLNSIATSDIDGGEGSTISAPLKIAGTFAAPKISVDMEELVVGRLRDEARGLIDRALGGGANDAESGDDAEDGSPVTGLLRGLVGPSTNEEAPENGAQSSGAEAGKALRSLFNRSNEQASDTDTEGAPKNDE